MKVVNWVLFVLHVIVGIGAMAGGWAAISNPQAPLGADIAMLNNSPFSNFLIPGIILFGVIGLGNIFSAITMCLKSRFQGYISSVFSWALVIWIIVQCIMINAVVFLHVLFFAIGLVQAALAMIILFKQQLFPSTIIIKLYRKVINK
jgi:hypothetical protein